MSADIEDPRSRSSKDICGEDLLAGSSKDISVELCAEGVAEAQDAAALGCDRIELCAAMIEDGITPSMGTILRTMATTPPIALRIMIRPRGGDFRYSSQELDVMLADIAAVRALPNPHDRDVGFVFGALTPENAIDVPTSRTLVDACGGASSTFHKAFDLVADQARALTQLIDLGFDKVLTSGGAPTAMAGRAAIEALVDQAAGRIGVIAAGSISAATLPHILATGVRDVHLRVARHTDAEAIIRDVRCGHE